MARFCNFYPASLDGVFSLREYKSHSTCKHSLDCSGCFNCCLLKSSYLLNALLSDNNSNTVYVLGHKYVLGPSQRSF